MIWSTPVVGDIDGDGRKEIIVGNMRDRIYAWHGDGSVQEGNWPTYVGSSVANACALADLDGDGNPEVLAGLGNGLTTALKHDGTALAGWPAYAEPGVMNSPSVADLDVDGSPDVVVPSADPDGHLHLFKANGTRFPGAPYVTGGGMSAAPTIAAPDPANPQRPGAQIIVGAFDRLIYNWTLPWDYDPSTAEWPTFMHDFRRTGSYGPDTTGQPVLINRIATVKYYPDGAWVRVPGKIVTATLSDFERAIYVQEPDRSCGIRVEPITVGLPPIDRWQSVDVIGRLATIDGERVLVDASIEPGVLSIILRPMAMSNRRLGG
ncbi:MAG: FG-GAP repeat domain-containing protein, partial [Armatimonadota bacterium]